MIQNKSYSWIKPATIIYDNQETIKSNKVITYTIFNWQLRKGLQMIKNEKPTI